MKGISVIILIHNRKHNISTHLLLFLATKHLNEMLLKDDLPKKINSDVQQSSIVIMKVLLLFILINFYD